MDRRSRFAWSLGCGGHLRIKKKQSRVRCGARRGGVGGKVSRAKLTVRRSTDRQLSPGTRAGHRGLSQEKPTARESILIRILWQESSVSGGDRRRRRKCRAEYAAHRLLLQRNRILQDLVKRRHRLGIGFKTPLRHDEIGELGRNVHVRQLQRAPGKCSQYALAGNSNHSWAGSQRRSEIGIAVELKSVIVGEVCQSQ